MKQKMTKFMKRLGKINYLKTKLICSAGVSNLLFALPVLAEEQKKAPSAKSFSTYVLGDWVSPIFALAVAFLVVKLFISQDWIKGAMLFVAGAVVYFLVKDPQAFLDTLSTIPEKFGF
ncbi:TcpD family membrane protein [Enterococcus faecium]|uniref:TcpD family membrane protein n=1 Tax=Enterococcus faecium TaxID=1352 RepID=UPI001D0ECCA6|nr:TcpD family membrane protein [Enterococcus faecium]